MTENQVKILDGNTFVVSDERGDIEASLTDPTGLFSFDTRFLSRWVLPRRKPDAGLAGAHLPRSGRARISSYFRSL